MNPALSSFLDLVEAATIISDVDLDQNDRPKEWLAINVEASFLEELALALGFRPRWNSSVKTRLEAAVKEDI